MLIAIVFKAIVIPVLISIYSISILLVIGFTILENRNPLKTISWILVLLLLPGLGFVFFIFFGQNLRKQKIIARKGLKNHQYISELAHSQVNRLSEGNLVDHDLLGEKQKLVQLLLNNSNAVLTIGNKVDLLHNGQQTFEAIVDALKNARDFIHLEYYIFANDEIGSQIKEILKERSRSGVEVRVIVDDVGSWELDRSFFKEMREAGVEIFSFLQVRFPLFTSKVNYRNHRKIIVVDGEIGFLGGINIADRYINGDASSYGIWRDTHLKVQGDAVNSLQSVFLIDWYFVSQKELSEKRYFTSKNLVGNQVVQIAASGPDTDWPAIMMGFFQAISAANKYVYIATPYFMPHDSVLLALKSAALSGVDVRVIIPGKSDAFITLLSSHSYLREMMESGVKFFFYEKGFLHSKVMIVDDVLGAVGSANMDFRSFEQNFEVTAFVYDREFTQKLKVSFMEDLADCREIFLAEWRKRPVLKKVKESFARLFSPLL